MCITQLFEKHVMSCRSLAAYVGQFKCCGRCWRRVWGFSTAGADGFGVRSSSKCLACFVMHLSSCRATTALFRPISPVHGICIIFRASYLWLLRPFWRSSVIVVGGDGPTFTADTKAPMEEATLPHACARAMQSVRRRMPTVITL